MLNYIKIDNFRNLVKDKIDVSSRHVILCGENGQGKSNFIEAIYYLIFAASFREQKEEFICRKQEDHFILFGEFLQQKDFNDRLGVLWDKNNGKRIVLNGLEIRDRKELVALFPCISFFHGDLQLIDGSMERRRRFFDQILSLISPSYIDSLRRYKKVLRQRNFVLRTNQNSMLDMYTQQLLDVGLVLMQERAKMTVLFQGIFASLMHDSSNLDIHCLYQSNWKSAEKEEILKEFNEKQEQEIRQGITLYGPHRDRYMFSFEGKEASHYLSLGQKRLLALCLKSAASLLFYQQSHREPILLLDDIFLELTHAVRERFLSYLPPYRQAFFTFLPQELAHIKLDSPLIYFVKEGKMEKYER